jgi:hypothetical protein
MIMPIRILLFTVLALVSCAKARAQSSVDFFFSTHPDDWQLFMNPNGANNVQYANSKVIFVYTTAGDGGNGAGPAGATHPYYLGRENGAKMSVRFVVDGNTAPADASLTTAVINGHPIERYGYRNTVSYFLRLFDGSVNGGGYASTGWQSLLKLETGQITSLGTVDQSTTYFGWADLAATLNSLITLERGACAGAELNLPDPDASRNPGDHPDHIATGNLVLDAVAGMPGFGKILYSGYGISSRAPDLSPDDLQLKTATFAQVIAGLNSFGWAAPWDAAHRDWLKKTYYRVDPIGSWGCGAIAQRICALPRVTGVAVPDNPPVCRQYASCCSKPL